MDWALTALKRNTAINLALKIGLSATIYHLWLERNSRMHNGNPCSALVLVQKILQTIKDKVTGVPRLKKSSLQTVSLSVIEHLQMKSSVPFSMASLIFIAEDGGSFATLQLMMMIVESESNDPSSCYQMSYDGF